jgi:hypothetical protein
MSISPSCQTHVEPNLQPTTSDASNFSYGTDHAIIEGRYITSTQEVNSLLLSPVALGDCLTRYIPHTKIQTLPTDKLNSFMLDFTNAVLLLHQAKKG